MNPTSIKIEPSSVTQSRIGNCVPSMILALLVMALMFPTTALGQFGTAKKGEEKEIPEIKFEADFDDTALAQSHERAWEFRPYKVAVWFCLDGSPTLDSIYKSVARDVTRRSELIDPSGWDLTTGKAPSKWRNRFRKHIESPREAPGFDELAGLKGFDKLMVVCMDDDNGIIRARVREFDVQTQLWGPLLVREVVQKQQLGNQIMDAISVAFMPLARIDRVQEIQIPPEKEGDRPKIKDEVVMRVRAINTCVRSDSIEEFHQAIADAESDEEEVGDIDPVAIAGSPVFVKDDDRFLPIIRRTDRQGNLVKLEPIEFTYLMVDKQDPENAEIRSSIQSYHRAPLAQRKSKRAQKLAVVIRPPERPTRLFLYSQDKAKTPLEGFEIWSRRPGQPIEEKSEFITKTDWRGSALIPPSENGLRLIYVKRGARALKKLPIMPGLYEEVGTTLPNDETRLFAEGIIRGLENEILSLVIRRQVLESDIASALEKESLESAKLLFDEYRDLDTPQDIKERMSTEEIGLKTQTSDKRELAYINAKFETLRKIVDAQQKESKEVEITKSIQELSSKRSGG